MKYAVILLIIIVQCTLADSKKTIEDPFMRSIKGKTYYTWTYTGDIDKTQKYTVQDEGKIIHYQSTVNFDNYNYVHIQTLSSNQAIYLQKSSAQPLYFALITANDGKDIYQAFNPNSANTNDIDWNSKINFIKSVE